MSSNYNRCDRIVVSRELSDKIFEWGENTFGKDSLTNGNSVPYNEVLNEGIIVYHPKFTDGDGRVFQEEAQVYFCNNENGIQFKVLGRPFEFFIGYDGKVEMDAGEISTEPGSEHFDDEVLLDGIIMVQVLIIKFYLYLSNYIESNFSDPEIVTAKTERVIQDKKPRKNGNSSGKNRKVKFSRKVYEVRKFTESGAKNAYQRHIESWTVRGHFRRYKSGKVVYVKPHIKGSGKITPKDYTV